MTDIQRQAAIRAYAKATYEKEGDLEFDTEAMISEVDSECGENGAYVQCWKWVDFEGTQFDKKEIGGSGTF